MEGAGRSRSNRFLRTHSGHLQTVLAPLIGSIVNIQSLRIDAFLRLLRIVLIIQTQIVQLPCASDVDNRGCMIRSVCRHGSGKMRIVIIRFLVNLDFLIKILRRISGIYHLLREFQQIIALAIRGNRNCIRRSQNCLTHAFTIMIFQAYFCLWCCTVDNSISIAYRRFTG